MLWLAFHFKYSYDPEYLWLVAKTHYCNKRYRQENPSFLVSTLSNFSNKLQEKFTIKISRRYISLTSECTSPNTIMSEKHFKNKIRLFFFHDAYLATQLDGRCS